MKIEWDKVKAIANKKKHGVSFVDAAIVLHDSLSVTIDEDTSTHEERFVNIGMDGHGRLLVVVFTYRHNAIRLISARCATNDERRQYAG
ncbi:MAG: BrnT family toxin [Magnetococcales bacterium]|nr:BrnT family toxin [Magnetococcales bacterium]